MRLNRLLDIAGACGGLLCRRPRLAENGGKRSGMQVIVVGGGIGGLSLALSLHQAGIAVRVYEAVRDVVPLGVGINLQPTAVRELAELGRAPVMGLTAEGRLDLEELNDPALGDDEVALRLLALPGCGPYATAHMMMLLGRYSRLILDSWTRPTYARLNGRKAVDRTIERRFRRYREYAGLAFWLYLTRDWVAQQD